MSVLAVRWRRSLAAGVALAAAATLAACGSGSDSGGGAADSTPAQAATLTIYSGRSESLVGGLLDQLKAAVGVPVEVRYGSTGEMSAQILEEGSASPADVFFGQDAGALGALSKAGMLAPLPAEVTAPVDARYKAADNTWVATSARARVVAYNTDKVPADQLPANVDALLDPKWKGKIGYAPSNASWLSFVTGLRLLRGEDGARQWLTAFAAQDPQRFEGNGNILDALAQGTIDLGLVNHYYLYEKTRDKDPATYPVRNHYVPNDPLGLINVAGVGVVKSTDAPEAAQKAVAFLLSPQAQQYLVDRTAEYPTVAGVTPSRKEPPLPDLSTLNGPAVDLAALDSLPQTEQLLQEVGLL
ncbi:iron(III) transport system substrate-binding protein [Pseudonocardia thermophila]|jgi:ABC-type Fe3+ transport system, periplasmic component|uniref:Iron(III) transport system substrate-binding protein n=1 Tax=Pseudonocardia thermophila TaxID=1848 RepID=A0A1M7A676_PSETH|nr:iron ABC transporter substrate-binding protein [Pseudonocardia thermophila]SHL38188.1 iron(III) transport system substrate-binding protein [Pseudonocardia thermophila]